MKKIVIVGGGPAGMMAAITAARNGVQVLIIEHTKRLGSKILQTGNGKCNFTNLNMSEDMFQNDDRQFVKNVLAQYNEHHVIEFFKELGIYAKERNGYMYPHSETAASLQDALRLELERLNVDIATESSVLNIEKKDIFKLKLETCVEIEDDGRKIIKSDKSKGKTGIANIKRVTNTLKAQTIILATGSKAAPKSGSDGSGYDLAKAMGHKLKKVLPALVQLTSDFKHCKSMAGVRSTGSIKLYVDDKLVAEDIGEIQYTDYGISGIPVFQISRYAVAAVDASKKASVVIDMLPDMDMELLYQDIERRIANDSGKTVEQFFAGIINKKLVYAAAKTAGIDINALVGKVGAKGLKKLAECMKNFEMNINGFNGFDNAQVCQGGVKLENIDSNTMESKLCKGLYFAGEIIDIDGACGGYNLQWAWTSGYLAGKSAAEGLNK